MKISIHECTFHFLISCGWSTHHIYICAYDAFSLSLSIYICIYASKLFAIQKAIIIRVCCLSQSGALSTVLGRLEAKDLSCKTSPFNAWILRFSSDSIPLGLKFVGWGMLPVEQRHISLAEVKNDSSIPDSLLHSWLRTTSNRVHSESQFLGRKP